RASRLRHQPRQGEHCIRPAASGRRRCARRSQSLKRSRARESSGVAGGRSLAIELPRGDRERAPRCERTATMTRASTKRRADKTLAEQGVDKELANQVEALRQLGRSGEQVIRIERVTVIDGGSNHWQRQAVKGAVPCLSRASQSASF